MGPAGAAAPGETDQMVSVASWAHGAPLGLTETCGTVADRSGRGQVATQGSVLFTPTSCVSGRLRIGLCVCVHACLVGFLLARG